MSELIGIFASYPAFIVNYLTIGGFESFYEPGLLSGQLVGLVALSAVLGLVIGLAFPPPAEPAEETDPRAPATRKTGHARRFLEGTFRVLIVLTGGSLLLHSLMRLYGTVVSPLELGSVLDTVNAALAYGAVYLPLHTGAARFRHRITRLSRDPESTPAFARPTRIGLGVFELIFPVYFLIGLSQVHDIAFHLMLRPAIVSAVGTIVAVTGVVAIVLLVMRGNPPVKG